MTHTKQTPTCSALVDGSNLRGRVEDALNALTSTHKSRIDRPVREESADSLNLDAALQAHYPSDHRWDYLLGHRPTRSVIGLEPHSARHDQVSTVIAKRLAALKHLRSHLKPGARVAAWLWVASGRVDFADTEKTRLKLNQNGITFVGTKVLARHVPV